MISNPAIWTEFFERYYRDEINKLAYKIKSGGDGSRSLYVNVTKDLLIFQEGRLGEELLENPDVVLVHAEKGLANVSNIYGVSLEGCKPRFYSLPTAKRVLIRDLRSQHISKFVAVEGIVRKVTEVRPRIVEAAFACTNCGSITMVPQEDSQLRQPFECSKCRNKRLVFLPENSVSIDSQRVRIQEYPENLRGGEQPQTIDIMLEGDLAGLINPGDRVVINGIVRAKPRGSTHRKLTHMDLYIEGNSVEILQQEYEEFEITDEDKEKILQLATSDDIYDKVVRSIAPSIYGHEDIKLAIALQLFGGVPKKLPDGTEIRGDIHILLVGDPGVAKSQLLRYVHRIAPRSVYTTGKGTTTAGLCVAPDTIVFTADGWKEIREIVEACRLNKAGDGIYVSNRRIKILSVNSNHVVFKDSDKVWKIKSPEILIRIRTETGKEICTTPATKILTTKGWIEASALKVGDVVATAAKLPDPKIKDELSMDDVSVREYIKKLFGERGQIEDGKVFIESDDPKTLQLLLLRFEIQSKVLDNRIQILSVDKFSKLVGRDLVGKSEELPRSGDIVWEKVVEVKEEETSFEFVYDLTVNDSHSFIANGIVVHNTATAVRDEVDGRWTLEAGALVLADKGVALVDEIDKMRKEDRSALHEALEQQTISIAKAGINAILRARCALLGAANPKYGRFDIYTPIAEQIDLSPTLLSRFDLIFVMRDEPDEIRDRDLARHILESHQLGEMLERRRNVSTEYSEEILKAKAHPIEPLIEPELLRKYIAYARKTVFPVLSEEAKRRIEEYYVSLRSKAKDNSPMPITARQLESIIRLAEASARMRLSDKVEVQDVERVIRIMEKSLAQIAVDPETGEIDIDYAFSGTSKRQRDRILTIKKIIEELEDQFDSGVPEEEIIKEASREGIEEAKVKEILTKLKQLGEIYSPRFGRYRLVAKP